MLPTLSEMVQVLLAAMVTLFPVIDMLPAPAIATISAAVAGPQPTNAMPGTDALTRPTG